MFVRMLACSWLSSPYYARSSSSACLDPRTTCTPSSNARALMMVVVRAILSSRATAPSLASSTAALAIGEPLARCLQLSSHCRKELLEVILEGKHKAGGRLAMGVQNAQRQRYTYTHTSRGDWSQ